MISFGGNIHNGHKAKIYALAGLLWAVSAVAQECQPLVSDFKTVVTAAERATAGAKAVPPITDQQNGFAWPDSELGVVKTSLGYAFFASDGGHHSANNKYGSVTRTSGTLDNPLGTGPPIDVIIHPNPIADVNSNYGTYTYLGGGRVLQVSDGYLLGVYHAEINTATSFYSLLGLAVSHDGGVYWTDLGEIIRLNQPYEPDLAGFDIGSPRLVTSLDGKYFYLYFPDWIANGTTQPTTATVVSVARATVNSVVSAAVSATAHAAPFEKYYEGAWDQPGLGGLSTDLNPEAGCGGSPNVAYNAALQQYVMISDDTENISYSESADGLAWTLPVLLFESTGSEGNYAVPMGMGEDPNILGRQFYTFFTAVSGEGWPANTVERFTVTCKNAPFETR